MPGHPLEVSAEQLYAVCRPEELSFDTTDHLQQLVGTIGQDRALDALDFGLAVDSSGHNVFVAGPPGSGRSTTVLQRVGQLARELPAPSDLCYVNNLEDAYRPHALSLAPGVGVRFANDMNSFIDRCRAEIPRAFDAEAYQQRRQQITAEIDRNQASLMERLEQEANLRGLTVRFGPAGVITIPVVEGKPLQPEEFQALPDPIRKQIRERGEGFQDAVNATLRQLQDSGHLASDRLGELDRETGLFAVGHLIDGLMERYRESPPVVNHLNAVRTDIVEHLDLFRGDHQREPEAAATSDRLGRYRVNVLVSHDPAAGAPVVFERNPTYYNLMGRIEYRPAFGTMTTDFRMIKAGALHRANGGYLVLPARELLMNPLAWEALKRVLECGETAIENMWETVNPVPTLSVRPEPIATRVKVVLIGTPGVHDMLTAMDEQFRKLFKVRADFDIEMERTPENVAIYAQVIGTRARDSGLVHLDRAGVARVVEHGSRLLEDQRRLWTRFTDIEDLVSEAGYLAKKEGRDYGGAEHVQRAIASREYRSGMVRDKIYRAIREGIINIATSGSVVGQVNGLSVLNTSTTIFGVPSRITARVSPGDAGVVNVERETDLSGRLHSKGVLILSGYLAGKYARHAPLSLSATLTFEQLYNEVEGDSASSAELCCLLSALAGVPLNQGLAVTGSVNQNGEIQAVGGVQYKIEGFFDACRDKGLTGTQGVIIPAVNVSHVMLREDVLEAVRAGLFHVYAATHVEQVIELLTGLEAGTAGPDGVYPEGTLNQRIADRVGDLAERVQGFAAGRRGPNHREAPGALPAAAIESMTPKRAQGGNN